MTNTTILNNKVPQQNYCQSKLLNRYVKSIEVTSY